MFGNSPSQGWFVWGTVHHKDGVFGNSSSQGWFVWGTIHHKKGLFWDSSSQGWFEQGQFISPTFGKNPGRVSSDIGFFKQIVIRTLSPIAPMRKERQFFDNFLVNMAEVSRNANFVAMFVS